MSHHVPPWPTMSQHVAGPTQNPSLCISSDANGFQQPQATDGHCIHGAEQWRLLIDALAEVSHEGAGNVEAPDISQNKGADAGVSIINHPEVAAYDQLLHAYAPCLG